MKHMGGAAPHIAREHELLAIESDRDYTFNRQGGRTGSLTGQLPEFIYRRRKVR